MILRAFQLADAEAIAAIYAHHVRHGFGTFETIAPQAEAMATRAAAVSGRGLPFIVAEIGARLVGFTYASPFRERAAYDFTAEDSVYVDPGVHKQGVGRALLSRLIDECESVGLRRLIAVIGDSANAGSIGLHAALGFNRVGVVPAAGFKHGRWVDVVIMERAIGDGAQTPPPRLAVEAAGVD